MKLELLADNIDAHKTVAQWYFDEWASSIAGVTIDRVSSDLAKSNNRKSAPLLVIAKDDEEIIAAAQLKIREMDIYPEFEHWLAGVYVKESARGQGIAKRLVEDIIARAKSAAIKQLYLQTEYVNGGLYTACGFKALEQVEYQGRQVLVMVAKIDA